MSYAFWRFVFYLLWSPVLSGHRLIRITVAGMIFHVRLEKSFRHVLASKFTTMNPQLPCHRMRERYPWFGNSRVIIRYTPQVLTHQASIWNQGILNMIFEIFGFADTSGYFNNLVRQGPFVNHDDIGTQQHKTVQGGLSHHVSGLQLMYLAWV